MISNQTKPRRGKTRWPPPTGWCLGINPIGVCGISPARTIRHSPARYYYWVVKVPFLCTLQNTLQSLRIEQLGWQSYMPRKQIVKINKTRSRKKQYTLRPALICGHPSCLNGMDFAHLRRYFSRTPLSNRTNASRSRTRVHHAARGWVAWALVGLG
jgi:hypothetical protein